MGHLGHSLTTIDSLALAKKERSTMWVDWVLRECLKDALPAAPQKRELRGLYGVV